MAGRGKLPLVIHIDELKAIELGRSISMFIIIENEVTSLSMFIIIIPIDIERQLSL